MSDAADARKRAQEYREKQEQEGKKAKLSREDALQLEWNDRISNQIEEAMREGHFDNLRGKGKPLKLERNPFVREEMEMAYSLLEKNDLAPAWIGKRTEVLQAIADWRAKVAAGVRERGEEGETGRQGEFSHGSRITDHKSPDSSWQKQVDTWRNDLIALNKRIEVVNLEQPVASLEIYKLRFDEELQRAQKE